MTSSHRTESDRAVNAITHAFFNLSGLCSSKMLSNALVSNIFHKKGEMDFKSFVITCS